MEFAINKMANLFGNGINSQIKILQQIAELNVLQYYTCSASDHIGLAASN